MCLSVGFAHACHECIDGDLLKYKPAVIAFGVDTVRIPLTEVVIGAFVYRMIKIVGSWVQSDFVEQVRVELGFAKQRRGCFKQDGFSAFDQIVVRSIGDADISNIQWDRSQPFVRVGFKLVAFQGCHGSKTDVVI